MLNYVRQFLQNRVSFPDALSLKRIPMPMPIMPIAVLIAMPIMLLVFTPSESESRLLGSNSYGVL